MRKNFIQIMGQKRKRKIPSIKRIMKWKMQEYARKMETIKRRK